MQEAAKSYFQQVQSQICEGLEAVDGSGQFNRDEWERPDAGGGHGGGGLTRVLKDGQVFEQAGVNFSSVHGKLPIEMGKKLLDRAEELPFYACGTSLVLHPKSPMVPTVHANWRYLQVAEKQWFGGGTDLTPYYIFPEDCQHFHTVLRSACDRHSEEYYPRFKQWCDEYFYLPHRGEARGIGGIFFDYLGRDDESELPSVFEFVKDVSGTFLDCYIPIVERRRELPWGQEERDFHLLRRGRYVEFNLMFDRGTQFGIATGGRAESILMSLPPQVRWEYGYKPPQGSREEELVEALRTPREWA